MPPNLSSFLVYIYFYFHTTSKAIIMCVTLELSIIFLTLFFEGQSNEINKKREALV